MKAVIDRKTYDTDTDTQVAFKHVGEFGQADGYEEQLFITKTKLYFLYGNGGPESKYSKATITPIPEKEAKKWEKENKPKTKKEKL